MLDDKQIAALQEQLLLSFDGLTIEDVFRVIGIAVGRILYSVGQERGSDTAIAANNFLSEIIVSTIKRVSAPRKRGMVH